MARRNQRTSTQDKIAVARTKKATAFRKKATSLGAKAGDKLRDRDMGTRRKLAQALTARREGHQMVQLKTALSYLAEGLDADSLDYPLSALGKVSQVDDAVSVAARYGLDEAAIAQRGMEGRSLWDVQGIAAECSKPESSIGMLYGELGLTAPTEMVALIHRLHDIIEGSGCIDWNAEELLRLRAEVRLKKIPGFIPTPPALVDELLHYLNLQVGDRLLEPAAGDGVILERVREFFPDMPLHCCEINLDLNRILQLAGFEPECRDYFDWEPSEGQRPNKIAANPPFEGLEDADFIYRMWEHLAPGGRLATITSNSWSFSSRKKANEFRRWMGSVPRVLLDKENDRNAFKPSGCNILTRLLVLEKPE